MRSLCGAIFDALERVFEGTVRSSRTGALARKPKPRPVQCSTSAMRTPHDSLRPRLKIRDGEIELLLRDVGAADTGINRAQRICLRRRVVAARTSVARCVNERQVRAQSRADHAPILFRQYPHGRWFLAPAAEREVIGRAAVHLKFQTESPFVRARLPASLRSRDAPCTLGPRLQHTAGSSRAAVLANVPRARGAKAQRTRETKSSTQRDSQTIHERTP
jgi:hypothetical protein